MTNIGNNLNNLFNNYQNTKNRKDVTGDGKFNSKDTQALSKEKTSLLKQEDVFDATGDGKVTQDDLDLFTNGFDIDGDGQISDMEKNFEKTYLSTMVSQMKKSGEVFTYNGYTYSGGKLASGVVDGKYYVNGKLGSGTVKDGTKTTVYKNGEVSYSTDVPTTDSNGYPKISGNKVTLANGTTITMQDGYRLKQDENGEIVLDDLYARDDEGYNENDGFLVMFDSAGERTYSYIHGQYSGDSDFAEIGIKTSTTDSKGRKLVDGKLANGVYDGKLYSAGNLKTGSATIKEDGKNVSYMFKDGEKANGLVNNKMYADGKVFTGTASDGKYYKNGVAYSGTVKDGNKKTTYKNGEVSYSTEVATTDTNGYPKVSGNKVTLANGTTITMQDGYRLKQDDNGEIILDDLYARDDADYQEGSGFLVMFKANGELDGMPCIDGQYTGDYSKLSEIGVKTSKKK